MMKIVIIALTLLATAATAEVYTVPADRSSGGVIDVYVDLVNDLNAAGTRVEVRVPACSSACTFFILADDVCVSARTIFEFHGPSQGFFGVLGLPIRNTPTAEGRRRIAHANKIMAENYNLRWPGLGDWFTENAAEKFGLATTRVRGSSLSAAFGVPICAERQQER